MATSQRDIKLLWGRAANRCALAECRKVLSQGASDGSHYPLGDQAHIVAREPEGPRGASNLTTEERDRYSNLILVCTDHHRAIDNDVVQFSVERLHLIKAEHELWVEQTLGAPQDPRELAIELIYATLIDAAVELCGLREWEDWSFGVLSPTPQWPAERVETINQFRRMILAAAWPGAMLELEAALQSLAIAAHQAARVFMRHSELIDTNYRAVQFYKIDEWNPDRYHALLSEWENWTDSCYEWVYEATQAANWLADMVRRHLNPMFFAKEGKFLITQGPMMPDADFQTILLEYSEAERASRPDELIRKIEEEKQQLTDR